ncbi:MAG TPA: CocE/NonD family hydrolase C-terminal non-catalytic domain-containing protein, partial [Solirubrobacteraceae bacterium]
MATSSLTTLRAALLAAALLLLLAAAPASASLATLKGSCTRKDAADGNTANGVTLPYIFCDDGVPNFGGRTPNPGAQDAVAVPAKYAGFAELPPKAADAASMPGADANGNIALDVDVSLPDPSFSKPRGGFPLMVMMHGCCAGNKTSWEAPTIDAAGERWHYNNAWFAARGFVVLNFTARGFVNGPPTLSPVGPTPGERGSTGETQLDSRRFEINDYQYLAGLLADDRSFFHINRHKIVTTGGSYGGGFAWLALTDPTWDSPDGRHLRLAASAPRYGWTDLVYSLVPNGTHLRDQLPAFDGSDSLNPIGRPKQSINLALFASGTTGTGDNNHTTFPPSIFEAFTCLATLDPETSPLCANTVNTILPEFIRDRSAYYQNDFFKGLARHGRRRVKSVPLFSAGTLTDPLFPSHEHRLMVDRLQSVDPHYPVQEYYGDYQHFVQNKDKEWGDVCGADHHVCRLADFPDGDLNEDPTGLLSTGVTTRLNRFVDHFVRPAGDRHQHRPDFDVTASLQACADNAASLGVPADEPGPRFTADTFDELAPNTLTIENNGPAQATAWDALDAHALHSDPVATFIQGSAGGEKCIVEKPDTPASPGVASFTTDPLTHDVTMIGRTRLIVPHTGAGSGIQLNARLYDVFPGGSEAIMVDRGPRRIVDPNETTTFDIQGNGWRFPAGHKIRVELTQNDAPYVKASTTPS